MDEPDTGELMADPAAVLEHEVVRLRHELRVTENRLDAAIRALQDLTNRANMERLLRRHRYYSVD